MNIEQLKKINWIQAGLAILFFAVVLGFVRAENGMDMNETRNTIALLLVASKVMDFATARSVINALEKRDLGKQMNRIFDAAKVITDALGGSTEATNQGATTTTTTTTVNPEATQAVLDSLTARFTEHPINKTYLDEELSEKG